MNNNFLSKTVHILGPALICAVLWPVTAQASQAVPRPGESIEKSRQNQSVELKSDLENETVPNGEAVHFTLTEIRVDYSNLKLKEKDISKITGNLLGRKIGGNELNEMIASLTRYARRHGYPVAAAYIPAQTAVDGKLLVKIEPGRLDKIHIANESRLKTPVVEKMLTAIKEGEIIRTNRLENALYNLQNLGGVTVYGVLGPGSKIGTSDLTVRLEDKKKTAFTLYTENYGNESAGRYRYGLQGEVYNLSGFGDRLNIGTQISNQHQHNYNISYERSVGKNSSKLGIGFSRADYELGNTFKVLGAEGLANTYSIYGRTPLWNTSTNALALTYGYDYRDIKDTLSRFNVSWKKHSHVLHLGLDGYTRSNGTNVQYNAMLYTGTLVPDSEMADTLASVGRTKGRFTKGTVDVTAVQRLNNNFDVLLKLSGQKAANNLDSSEHIYLGGARGIRAYPQGEASGDEGILGSVELRYHTPIRGLLLSTYFDSGYVKIAKDADDSMTLKGWGIGLTYSKPGDWFARLDYARRIGTHANLSEDAKSRQRMWFILGKIF